MKRNMDLIREILLFAEANCDGLVADLAKQGGVRLTASKLPENYRSVSDTVLEAHLILLQERNLLEVNFVSSGVWKAFRLTWEGHDFLDNSRSPKIWNAAKKAVRR